MSLRLAEKHVDLKTYELKQKTGRDYVAYDFNRN